ncbi:DUF3445 domain-containing protein [Oceanicella sp. SM1341]|uniref:heme-dependent oxidative N-demethylase family protein n=1 Tax=Oceanicella sp. SM1341 TaxID=1548889 RepID=UPI000E4F1C0A|nr:DUF3445 domain-containing protein [Oceanicella sp. SM1341]
MDPTHLDRLPILPFMEARTATAPGVQPLDPAEWLRRDAAFAPQMALRDGLVTGARRDEVYQQADWGRPASEELLATVLGAIAADPGYAREGDVVTRPDGVTIDVTADAPLATIGRLVQEDFLVLERREGEEEHHLGGGILCFPSRWSLQEKMRRGLLAIHGPVPFYEESLSKRVQRFFDAIRPGRPLWRANWVLHTYPELFQPISKANRQRNYDQPDLWLRVERQTLSRLPQSGAVIFTVKTDVAHISSVTPEEGTVMLAEFRKLPEKEFTYKGGAQMIAKLADLFPEEARVNA